MRVKIKFNREQRGLGIERIKNGFDQQNIRAAVQQALDGFGVSRHQLIETGIAITGVVHIRRNAGGAIGGAEHTCDEARLVRRFGFEFIRRFARKLGSFHIQFVYQCLHPIIRHGDRGGIESIGLQNIRARVKIGGVDIADDFGLGQRQQVVVALEIGSPILETLAAIIRLLQLITLDHGAHRAIQNQDALGEQFIEQIGAVVGHKNRGKSHEKRGS